MNRDSRFVIRLNRALLIYTFVIALPFSWASFAIGSVYRAVTLCLFVIFLFESKFVIKYSNVNKSLFLGWLFYLGYTVATRFWSVNREAGNYK